MRYFGTERRKRTPLSAAVIAWIAVLADVSGAHAWTFKTLYSFCAEQQCTDGDWPMGTLLLGSDGNLYGVTNMGGLSDNGVVYQFSPKALQTEKVLYSFCPAGDCSRGQLPEYGLVEDTAGSLYGETHGGARNYSGTIFKLTPDADHENWAFNTLYKFCSKRDCADGSLPSPLTYAGASIGLRYDGVSPLYGTTSHGGKYNGGTTFNLEPPAGTGRWHEQVLHDYCVSCTTDGAQPWSGLLVERSGSLLGTSSYGGSHGEGTVFELTASDKKWKQSILYEFCAVGSCTDGDTPMAALISDAAGNLYGDDARWRQIRLWHLVQANPQRGHHAGDCAPFILFRIVCGRRFPGGLGH
jgi:uncharacterized repeat protein (TIGR03803 family)